MPQAVPTAPAAHKSAWSPLAIPLFRALWLATVVSNIGTWAQEAGGPWLMKLLKNGDPKWVALVAVAENVPIFLLTIIAGVLADVVDRRKLLIWTQLWMLAASGALGILTLLGMVTAGWLLFFWAVLGVGIAISGPPFQAIVPELVAPADMPLAVALNSVALNVARAVGPAIGVAVMILAGGGVRGSGAAFLLNAGSFLGVAYVLYRWNRPRQAVTAHAEQFVAAFRLGFRFTRHSPPMLAILVRVAAFILCAVAMWAQLPIISDRLGMGEGGYGILMACLGAGAVVGVVMMPRIQRQMSIDAMVAACTVCFAAGLMLLGVLRVPALAFVLMLFLGFNWVIIPTNFNVATQRSVPNWVKGRALAMYMTTLFGSWALGSAIWGAVAKHSSISTALLLAGILMITGLVVFSRFRLTMALGSDFTPAFAATHLPPARTVILLPSGYPEYHVTVQWPANKGLTAHTHEIRELRRQRLRNGASSWKFTREESPTAQWAETFLFRTEAEFAQYHSRTTKADLQLHESIQNYGKLSIPKALTPAGPHPAAVWLSDQFYWCADRALEEVENMINRFESQPEAASKPQVHDSLSRYSGRGQG
jgi:MFS family permease